MEMSLNEWIAAIKHTRESSYTGLYRDLYLDVGYFMAQFGAVELILTTWLLTATQSRDVETFNILVSGMDAKVKVDRLRKAMRKHGAIGPNLAARFDVFEQQAIKLRNTLAHNALAPDEGAKELTYSLFTVVKQPLGVKNRPPEAQAPDKIKSARIWGMGLWLNTFAHDLNQMRLTWLFQSTFEITEPRSPVLLASRE